MTRRRSAVLAVLAYVCAVSLSSTSMRPSFAAPQRVLVTGGNKGIGFALCRELAAEKGCEVVLTSRDASRGKEAVERIVKEHPECKDKVHFVQMDVSDEASVKEAAAKVREMFAEESAPLYAIKNNAGIAWGHPFEDVMECNMLGTKRVVDAFLPLLCQKEGRIVNTASASGPNYVAGCGGAHRSLLTDPDLTMEQLDELIKDSLANPAKYGEAYGFSKACVNAYTRILAREQDSVKVNAVTPGFILTDMTRGMGANKSPKEGTKAAMHTLFGELEGNGWYYGSDAQRSPIDRYRSPGDPPYTGP